MVMVVAYRRTVKRLVYLIIGLYIVLVYIGLVITYLHLENQKNRCNSQRCRLYVICKWFQVNELTIMYVIPSFRNRKRIANQRILIDGTEIVRVFCSK